MKNKFWTSASFPNNSGIEVYPALYWELATFNPQFLSSQKLDNGNLCSGHLGYARLNRLMHTVSCCWRTPLKIHFIAPAVQAKNDMYQSAFLIILQKYDEDQISIKYLKSKCKTFCQLYQQAKLGFNCEPREVFTNGEQSLELHTTKSYSLSLPYIDMIDNCSDMWL